MRKKWFRQMACAAFILFIMAAQMRVDAAPDSPEAVSYFIQGQTLYAFCDMKGRETQGMTVKQFDSSSEAQNVSPPLSDESGTVHYVLVIDGSSSMDPYQKKVQEFVETLVRENERTNLNAAYTLATIGDTYSTILERAEDGTQLLEKIKKGLFRETKSNLYQGVVSALDKLNQIERRDGELTDVIIISDGVLYRASEYPARGDVEDLLTAKKENLVQTVGMDGKIAFGSMQYDGTDMTAAAADITHYVGSLSRICFLQKTNLSGVKFYFREGEKLADGSMTVELTDIPVIGRLKNILNGESSSGDGESKPDMAEESGTESQSGGENKESEGKERETDGTKEGTGGETENSTKTDENDAAATEGTGAISGPEKDDGKKAENQAGSGRWFLFGMLAGVAVLLCGMFLFFYMKARRKRRTANVRGIPVELEVLSGRCATRQRRFYLLQELLIGSAEDCDIVFDSKAVSPKNTRIFLYEGILYIEDLKSDRGTAIGGMRIYAPNILRSGEVISIERVAFRIIYSSGK